MTKTSLKCKNEQACRHEFHRRLKVYHAWKAKNRKRTTMDENERAPRSVMEAAIRSPLRVQPKQDIIFSTHRYFRIPFVRASNNNTESNQNGNHNGLNSDSSEYRMNRETFLENRSNFSFSLSLAKRGLWYAHFDGQYVARQMELHTDKPPILLVAGKFSTQLR